MCLFSYSPIKWKGGIIDAISFSKSMVFISLTGSEGRATMQVSSVCNCISLSVTDRYRILQMELTCEIVNRQTPLCLRRKGEPGDLICPKSLHESVL